MPQSDRSAIECFVFYQCVKRDLDSLFFKLLARLLRHTRQAKKILLSCRVD